MEFLLHAVSQIDTWIQKRVDGFSRILCHYGLSVPTQRFWIFNVLIFSDIVYLVLRWDTLSEGIFLKAAYILSPICTFYLQKYLLIADQQAIKMNLYSLGNLIVVTLFRTTFYTTLKTSFLFVVSDIFNTNTPVGITCSISHITASLLAYYLYVPYDPPPIKQKETLPLNLTPSLHSP